MCRWVPTRLAARRLVRLFGSDIISPLFGVLNGEQEQRPLGVLVCHVELFGDLVRLDREEVARAAAVAPGTIRWEQPADRLVVHPDFLAADDDVPGARLTDRGADRAALAVNQLVGEDAVPLDLGQSGVDEDDDCVPAAGVDATAALVREVDRAVADVSSLA